MFVDMKVIKIVLFSLHPLYVKNMFYNGVFFCLNERLKEQHRSFSTQGEHFR